MMQFDTLKDMVGSVTDAAESIADRVTGDPDDRETREASQAATDTDTAPGSRTTRQPGSSPCTPRWRTPPEPRRTSRATRPSTSKPPSPTSDRSQPPERVISPYWSHGQGPAGAHHPRARDRPDVRRRGRGRAAGRVPDRLPPPHRAQGYVLGISGGVDSTTAGRLCQLSCERARREGLDATLVAVRLPYGLQADEAEAAAALRFVGADRELTVNIKTATDTLFDAVTAAGLEFPAGSDPDFAKGNVKARERMVAQYLVAGALGMAVVGTDHGAEAVVGFYTKFGDGAADLTPLSGLDKRRVKAIAKLLGAPAALYEKVPTADLEDGKPLAPDSDALGVSYDAVDDYLEGKDVSPQDEATILRWYSRTAHKRAMPVTPGLP